MKKLLELINKNDDEQLLSYIKSDFKNKIALYINILDRSAQMQKELNQLKLESETRSTTIDNLSKFLSGGELNV